MDSTMDRLDILTFWLLNVSASFMLSAAHNVLFFVLDWRTPIIHFLHFLSTFGFLLLRMAFSADRPFLPRLLCSLFRAPVRRLLWPPLASQFLVTMLSSVVHAQNRAGGLYLTRIFDFLGTLLVIRTSPAVLGEDSYRRRAVCSLLVLLLLLSPPRPIWPLPDPSGPVRLALLVHRPLSSPFPSSQFRLEFGHIEYDSWALCLSPVLALAQGVHLLLLKRAQLQFFAVALRPHCAECRCSQPDPDLVFQRFALCYASLCSAALAGPALISFAGSRVPYDASWESFDYVMMGMSAVFMASFKFSELWLQCRLEPHHFCALEHSKFFMASIGQWFLQNMAHATFFAALGKALFVASSIRYWTRLGEMRAKEKCGPKSSLAGAG